MNRRPAMSLGMIRSRADLLRQLRRWFDDRGFLEVQPPCLSCDCVLDMYIDPIEVRSENFKLAGRLPSTFYLQTSPEAAMKRMLAAGAPSIYSLGPVFRAGECGDLHNVEFTMLEWYQVDADIADGIKLLGQLVSEMLGRDGYDVCSYRELFRDSLGCDPIDEDLAALRRRVADVDHQLAASIGDDRDGLLDVLLSQRIQPGLGMGRPKIVRNYPLSQAALARGAADDDQCAARFELFVDGVEMANGYDELRDADVLIERFEHCNQVRKNFGKNLLPIPELLIQAMRDGLPRCTGVALGVDRLLMVRTGEKSIANVMPFPIESA